MTSQTRSKRWAITLNNPEQSPEELWDQTIMSYLIVGKEVASTGTPHYQTYMETNQKLTMGSLKAKLLQIWNKACHLEPARGSLDQNQTYCKKEGQWTEFGTPMKQGARTDLSSAIAAIVSGSSMRELWMEHSQVMVKYSNGMKLAYQNLSPQLNTGMSTTYSLDSFLPVAGLDVENIKSIILWGPAGIGKTYFARALLPNALFVSHIDELLKYDPREFNGIIFDDMSFMHYPRETQIHIVDFDMPRALHCRYSVATIPAGTPKIFTTNVEGGHIFNAGDKAIQRRLQIYAINGNMWQTEENIELPDSIANWEPEWN